MEVKCSRDSAVCRGILLSLLACLLVGGVTRFQHISSVSYYFDESASWKTATFTWSDLIDSVSKDNHPPLYFLLLKAWSEVASDSPLAGRLLGVLCGLLAIPASFWFVWEANSEENLSTRSSGAANDLWDRVMSAAFVAALMALSPAQIQASQQNRMYSLAVLLNILCGIYLLKVIRHSDSLKAWLLCGITGMAMTLTHYYGLFTGLAFALMLTGCMIREWLSHGWSRQLKGWLVGTMLTVWGGANLWSFWYPVLQKQRTQVAQAFWIPPVSADVFFHAWREMLAGPGIAGASQIPAAVVLMLLLALPLGNFAFGGIGGRLVALAYAVPVVMSVWLSWIGPPIFHWRYMLFPQTFLLLACGIISFRIPARIRGAVIPLVLIGASCATYAYMDTRERLAEKSGLRQLGDVLNTWCEDGHLVIVGSPVICLTVECYARNPENVFVVDRGAPYAHFQGGPQLTASDYIRPSALSGGPHQRIFTVDVRDLFYEGNNEEVRLGAGWTEVRSMKFEEANGHPCQLVLREWERD